MVFFIPCFHETDEEKAYITITGILMRANTPLRGKFGSVRLVESETKVSHIIKVPISLMKDVVQPFYEEHVTINGYSEDGKLFLEEIRLSSED